ncbi:MAG: RIP metalloprotease RseP [Clostridia bacterium]|nr:RIP metalloprotease RseP [Clostridia bacterium]
MKTAILAILLFCVLIFPHELGHFVVAKMCKVQVNEFALGMGPAIFKKQRGETLYSLRAIPIGGYCAMEGENEESENPRAFNNKKAWQKICVLVAGSFMNVLICVVIMIIMAASTGTATTIIDKVQEGMPAYGVIQEGDQIIDIDGKAVNTWNDVGEFLQGQDKTARITVLRDGNEQTLKVNVKLDEEANRKVIGITCKVDKSLGTSLSRGIKATGQMCVTMVDSLAMLFTGRAGMDDLAGPVGLISIVGQTSSLGLMYFFYLMAFISLNLAFVNMLPFPALDGGRILFVIIRKVTGKMITDEMEGTVHTIGMLLLLALMFYITWNDIVRLL